MGNNYRPDPTDTLERHLDALICEARFRSEHQATARQQVIDFVEANYMRRLTDRAEILAFVLLMIEKHDLTLDLGEHWIAQVAFRRDNDDTRQTR